MTWAPVYVTTAELRAYITRSAVTVDDTQLADAAEAASRVVDDWCGRQFGKSDTVESRYYTAQRGPDGRYIETDDIATETGLVITWDNDANDTYDQAVDEYRLWPFNAGPLGRPWERIYIRPSSTTIPTRAEGAVRVTATFGWPSVPGPVKTATLIEANRIFQRRVSPFGIAGSPEVGSELRLLRQVDVDVQKILQPYRRLWAAVG